MLADPERVERADREIAQRCGVVHKTVSALQPQPVSGEIPR
jgi:hypothetical protein